MMLMLISNQFDYFSQKIDKGIRIKC